MIQINAHYLKLKASYLFSEIGKRVEAYQQQHPDAPVIRLGIGDVTRALPDACIHAFHQAIDEMAEDRSFRGYGPEEGYAFLREAIAENDFKARGADIGADEIFVSDGAKCDTGNIQEIFDINTRIAIPDPVYPAYLDTNVMAGRTGAYHDGRYEGIVYLNGNAENGFIPDLPAEPVDLIYLCFPNNPTGATITKDQLKQWVDYAAANKAIILFDAAYEAFIRDDSLPHSIYEIDGARDVAIEFRSFSKTAGFTGTRCAYTVVPKSLMAYTATGEAHSVHGLWNRRHSTKFNGVSYPVQRAAEAVYSTAGKAQMQELVNYYMENAALIRKEMQALGHTLIGGENSPYIWVATGADSWSFFDMLLENAGVVCTPGAGFGTCGEGYIRISAFNSHENVTAAMSRIRQALKS
ncbi:LL-diaminopimelate aminotransferase [Desulfosarcina ovata subsp. sediminis]|uniref:LL-diaminopimelate aminotransferase n=1 Tax=Desulfosarcina ovata subsp. sediminis TaxID=885957 RepID=A0A5K7ZIT1_9BACT|nr:LL-diaminopimelate aminotransferase [Desulfosarcina ovata]BBO79867.1 LL-diaminopimelate aminotransferase [Desulfosarcina ovata subsp. sediminis]